MKKLFTLLLTVLLLSGCNQAAPVEEETEPVDTNATVDTEEQAQEPSTDIYTWEEKGISFELPEELIATKGGDYLTLDTEDLTNFEGETPYGAIVISDQEKTVEEEIQKYKSNPKFTSETVSVEGRIYTKISFYGDLYEKTVSIYFIQDGKNMISINEVEENKDQVQSILKTLQF